MSGGDRAIADGRALAPRRGRSARALMPVVLIAAALMGDVRWWMLRLDYLDRARSHEATALRLGSSLEAQYWEARWADQRAGLPATEFWPAGPPFVPAIIAHHRRMQAKWARAAASPWVTVEPDPPGAR